LNKTGFQIAKDRVRERLNIFTVKAFQMLPKKSQPQILDVGCGSGVPALKLAQLSHGHVVGLDIDRNAIDAFKRKISESGLSDRVEALICSMSEMDFPKESFDIVWAEGSIDYIGFERGLMEWRRLLKPGGCLAVHDHNRDLSEKLAAINTCGYELLGYFKMDEQTWKKEYFFPMQRLINETRSNCVNNGEMLALLDREQQEIDVFKTDPASCCSVFFIMRKSRRDEHPARE